jgi:hypothetical protein
VTELWFGGSSPTGTPPIAGQSFLATKDGRLDNVQMLVGGAPATYDVHLYDLGLNAPAPTNVTTYSTALPDLLPADTWFRFLGTPITSVVVLYLIDAGLRDIRLVEGHTYVWEIVGLERDANGVLTGNNTATSAMSWYRNAPSAGSGESYLPNGQAFRQRSAINGNADRSFAMAVHLIPEPSTLIVASIGMLGLAFVNRRGRS